MPGKVNPAVAEMLNMVAPRQMKGPAAERLPEKEEEHSTQPA
jgi:fumarate hydratase class II